jgi:hypothetical protein
MMGRQAFFGNKLGCNVGEFDELRHSRSPVRLYWIDEADCATILVHLQDFV